MQRLYHIAYYTPSLSSLYAVCRKSQFGPHDYLSFHGVASIHVDVDFPVEFIKFRKLDEQLKRYYFAENDQYIDAVYIKGGLATVFPYVSGDKFLNQLSMHPIEEMSEQDFLDAEKDKWQFKDENELNDYVAKIDRSHFLPSHFFP